MRKDEDVDREIDQIRRRLAAIGSAELQALKRRDREALDAAWLEHDAALERLRALEQHRTLMQAIEPAVDQQLVDEIARRWQGRGPWCAPARNVLWVETTDGRPVAAVSCTAEELAQGELQRRREALAHAPEDIQTLLQTVRQLEERCAALAEALPARMQPEQELMAFRSPLRAVA
jgi:hypothetical protein